MKRRRAALLAAALLAAAHAPAPGMPGTPAEARAAADPDSAAAPALRLEPGVAVTVKRGPEGLEIEGRTRLHAMPAAAWAVLTDYEAIPSFVSSMRESRVTGRDGDQVVVEQKAVGRAFLFSKGLTTRLRVREEAPVAIHFEDELRKDFETYRGVWRIEGSQDEVEIVYMLLAQPSFTVPDMVARGAFKRAVRKLIGEVGAEIERRAQEAGLAGLTGG